LVAFLIFLFSLPIFADDKIDAWAYFQTQSEWTKYSRTFSLGTSRIMVDGKITKGISYSLQGQVSPTIQVIHVNFSLHLFKGHGLTIGQQSSPFKFFSPPPETKYTVVYPLGGLISNFDDIGVALKGKTGPFSYQFLMLNGKGANYKDDNKDKDFTVLMKFSPIKQFSLTGFWQGGWQKWTKQIEQRNYREGMWLQVEVKPVSGLTIMPTWVKRNDRTESKDITYQKEGWYVLGMYDITEKLRVLVQYLKDTNKETEWTVGLILKKNSRMRFLLDGTLRKTLNGKTDLGLYLMTQINIGKDL
jgi:hypothetical protein